MSVDILTSATLAVLQCMSHWRIRRLLEITGDYWILLEITGDDTGEDMIFLSPATLAMYSV